MRKLLLAICIVWFFSSYAQYITKHVILPNYITSKDTIYFIDSVILPMNTYNLLRDTIMEKTAYLIERSICYANVGGVTGEEISFSGKVRYKPLPAGNYTLLFYVKHIYNNSCEVDTFLLDYMDTLETTFTVHSPAAIPELSEASVTLLPNPAAEQVAITLDRSTTADIAICDMSGAVVSHAHLSNQHTVNIDIADLPKGMYIATIRSAAADIRKRLVKW